MKENEKAPSTEIVIQNLSIQLTDNAVQALSVQRAQLKTFVESQLRKDVDFGIIPGVKKPSLYKPGAEKLCKIFQLGSRIVTSDTKIDHENKFAIATYRVEIVHIPSGKVVAECEGSVNSREKKYFNQDMYSIVNTLQKMAQKRAFVGAVLLATNASEFLTQDVEDTVAQDDGLPADENTLITWGKYKPNKTLGEALAMHGKAFINYCEWCIDEAGNKKEKQRFKRDAQKWLDFARNGAPMDAEFEHVENNKEPATGEPPIDGAS